MGENNVKCGWAIRLPGGLWFRWPLEIVGEPYFYPNKQEAQLDLAFVQNFALGDAELVFIPENPAKDEAERRGDV